MPFFAPCLGIIAGYLKRNKIPVFGIVDNAIAHEKRLGDTMLVNYFLNKCDSHFTLSKKVKKDIKEINNGVSVESLFHPIYNTYSKITDKSSALKSLNLKDGKYVLFFGLIRKYKGLDLAIRAMSNKLIIEKNIKLIIAGEFYDSEDKYQDLIRGFKFEKYYNLQSIYREQTRFQIFFSFESSNFALYLSNSKWCYSISNVL